MADIGEDLIDALASAHTHNQECRFLQLPDELLHRVFLALESPDRLALLASCRQLRIAPRLLEVPRCGVIKEFYSSNESFKPPSLPSPYIRSMVLVGVPVDPTNPDDDKNRFVAESLRLGHWLRAMLSCVRRSNKPNPYARVSSVTLEGWDITLDDGPGLSVMVMRHLTELFPSIEQLVLRGCQYDPAAHPVMTPLLTRLRVLKVCDDSRTRLRGLNAAVKSCASFPSLRSLHIDLNDLDPEVALDRITPEGLGEKTIDVGPLRHLRNLKHLKLESFRPDVEDKKLRGLEGLLPKLESLELYGMTISAIPRQAMGAPSSIRSLTLAFCSVHHTIFDILKNLEEFSLIDVFDCDVGLAGMLSALLRIGPLKKVCFDGCIIEEEDISEHGMLQMPEINSLKARGVQVIVHKNRDMESQL